LLLLKITLHNAHCIFGYVVDTAGRQLAPSGESKHHLSARSHAGGVQGVWKSRCALCIALAVYER